MLNKKLELTERQKNILEVCVMLMNAKITGHKAMANGCVHSLQRTKLLHRAEWKNLGQQICNKNQEL